MVKEMNLVFILISLSRCKKFEKMSSRYCFLFSFSFLNKYIFKATSLQLVLFKILFSVSSFTFTTLGEGGVSSLLATPWLVRLWTPGFPIRMLSLGSMCVFYWLSFSFFKGLVRFHIQNRKPSLSRKHHFKDSNCIITWFFFSKFWLCR